MTDDIDARRRARRREFYCRTDVTYRDQWIDGFWVVTVSTPDGCGSGAAMVGFFLTDCEPPVIRATELAIQNYDRMVGR